MWWGDLLGTAQFGGLFLLGLTGEWLGNGLVTTSIKKEVDL
jgi:hypothetical protein